jgi:hypothetical protein
MNCCVSPAGTLGAVGVTATVDTVAALTVATAVLLTIVAKVAVILLVPVKVVLLVTKPVVLIAALEPPRFQVAVLLRSTTEPSEYVPIAVNCLNVFLGILKEVGLTAIEFNTALRTVRVGELLPAIVPLPKVALMVVVPTPVPVATPLGAIVATLGLDEVQTTLLVTSCVLPSV